MKSRKYQGKCGAIGLRLLGHSWRAKEVEYAIDRVEHEVKFGDGNIGNSIRAYREAFVRANDSGGNVEKYNDELLKVISNFPGKELVLS
ncbi:MAG: hypothetical protein U9Q06_01480 [Nanoarchaeota archaeon]|nr:hypothetical protein [Nanoarchaeota archaeon]